MVWWMFNGAAALGPMLAFGGWQWEAPVAFWIGVALCGVDEFMNVASGLHRLPVLALIFAGAGPAFLEPWFIGAGLGLACWTGLGFLGQFFGRRNAVG